MTISLQKTVFIRNGRISPIVLLVLSVFFWGLFDAILSYVTPLLMEETGLTITKIGIIIGMSSVIGAIFDYIFCRVFKNHDFRFVFLVMYCICLIYPLLLMKSKSIWLFLLAMGLWGIYYDLSAFGVFNYVGQHLRKEKHVETFGLISVIKSLAYLIGPFIGGLLIVGLVNWKVFASSWIFIVISIVFYFALVFSVRNKSLFSLDNRNVSHKRSSILEIRIWKKLAKSMNLALFMTFFIVFIDSFFWTLSPVFVEHAKFGWFGGLFLTAYILPSLFMGIFAKPVTDRFGLKRTALIGLLASSLILSLFVLFKNPIVLILLVFLSSCFTSLITPAIQASYADRISDSPQYDGEIESLEDFQVNLGYIFGPICAGILAGIMNISYVFSLLGCLGVIISVFAIIKAVRKKAQII